MRISSILLVVIAILCLVGTIACQAPEKREVLAEVGGHVITMDQLVEQHGAKQLVDQMIWEMMVVLECRERGIILDEVKYKESIENYLTQAGGIDAFKAQLDEMGFEMKDFFLGNRMQILFGQLIEDVAGEPSEQDIDKLWRENEERYRKTVAGRFGVPESEITKADAKEEIVREWKNMEQQKLYGTYVETLKEKYDVKNYLTMKGVEMKELADEKKEVEGLLDLNKEEELEAQEEGSGDAEQPEEEVEEAAEPAESAGAT
jgi:hypothetical protein